MKPPLVFVSYSHDTRDHQDWVREVVVNGLRRRSVDARMDVYELSYGDKVDSFMESFVASCDHVAVICTLIYAERAANDLGGVGYEKQLIRRFLAAARPGQKVIPILRAGGDAAVPAYLGTRLYVDMQSDEHTEDLLDELSTVMYGAHVHVAPPVGEMPPWLAEKLAGGRSPD